MNIILSGTVRTIGEQQTFKGTEYTKKNIIVTSLETRTPYSIDFSNNRISELEGLLLGQTVHIKAVIRGNIDQNNHDKAYNQIEGYALKVIDLT